MTNMLHVDAFISAMKEKDLNAMLSHMAEDVVLRTPLVAEPVAGKAAIRQVVSALLAVVDAFDFQEVMQGPHHVSSFFTLAVGAERLDGMDYWRLDATGLIREMTVLWRPLASIVAVHALLTSAADAEG